MRTEQFKHIAAASLRDFAHTLRNVTEHAETEMIHRLRVSYKQLRANFRMYFFVRGGPAFTMPAALKEIYTTAGELRNRQLLLAYFASTERSTRRLLSVYLGKLRTDARRSNKKLCRLIADTPLTGIRRKLLAAIDKPLPTSAFTGWLQAVNIKVKTSAGSRFISDTALHSIRKQLKDIHYNLKIYSVPLRRQLLTTIWKGKTAEGMESLLQALGNFQDLCSFIALLQTDQPDTLSAAAQKAIGSLRNGFIAKKKKLKPGVRVQLSASLLPR